MEVGWWITEQMHLRVCLPNWLELASHSFHSRRGETGKVDFWLKRYGLSRIYFQHGIVSKVAVQKCMVRQHTVYSAEKPGAAT